MTPHQIDVIARALALRKLKKIGILWAEDGHYWISENEYDPYGSRVRVSFQLLQTLVEEIEATVRKCPGKVVLSGDFDLKVSVADKNILTA